MSEENTIVIDNEEYDFDGLDVSTQANIARVNELRREISTLKCRPTSANFSCKPTPEPLLKRLSLLKKKLK